MWEHPDIVVPTLVDEAEPLGGLRAHRGELDGDLVARAEGQGLAWGEEEGATTRKQRHPSRTAH